MKARIKTTGEIIEIDTQYPFGLIEQILGFRKCKTDDRIFKEKDLDII